MRHGVIRAGRDGVISAVNPDRRDTAMSSIDSKPPMGALSRAALAVLPVVAASLLGQLATVPNLVPWYQGLAKPGFNPPDWVFAPVWTALYALMAFAAWRLLGLPRGTPGRAAALGYFFLQLALNAAWPWLFFALKSPLAALVEIVPQLLAILLAIDRFRRLDRIAAACLVPLAAWVAFAGVLTFAIWRLNP